MASNAYLPSQLRATRALVKFIADHRAIVDPDLESCLGALERADMQAAAAHAQNVKVSGAGGLTDWFPPVVFEHETREYVWAELDALAYNWARLMALSFEKGS